MSKRPLVPAFVCFVGGILTGRFLTYSYNLTFSLFILIVLILFFFFINSDTLKSYIIPFLFLVSGVFFTANHSDDIDLVALTSGKKVTIEGTVLSLPKKNDQTIRFELKTEKLFLENKIFNLSKKILVTVFDDSETYPIGTRIRFPAHLKPFNNFNNPGAYNYELSMRLKRMSCNASVSDGRYIVPMGRGNPGILLKLTELIRNPIRVFLKEKLVSRDYALYSALLLGETQGITEKLREPFNVTGMGHVLAVSGLHIGIIAWLSFFICKCLLTLSEKLIIRYDTKKIAALITCIPVIAYTGLSGFQVSGQRAMIMALTYLFSIVLEKERDIWSTLFFSALIILAIDPLALESISFQLTFLAVIGILWLTPYIQNVFPDSDILFKKSNFLKTFYFYITGIFSASLSATIFLLPVTVYYFYRITTISILANLLIIPLLGFLILPAGMFTLIALMVSPSIAVIILKTGVSGIRMMMYIIEYLAGLSWASFWMVTPYLSEILLFYCILFCIVFIRKWKWVKFGMIVTALLAVIDISFWVYDTRFDQNLRVTFIDVGQGNSALIQFPGNKRMLIDGGGFRTGTFDTGKNVVAPFLYRNKILNMDYLALSHPHPDHLNGLRFIASEFNPSEFWYNGYTAQSEENRELMDIVKSKNVKMLAPEDLVRGITISGVKVECLHTPDNTTPSYLSSDDNRDVNNRSLVLKFSYKGKSVLFTGDIEEETENRLVKNFGVNLKSDVLLVPHHGSKYSSTRSFIEKVNPEISIISSGKGNSFGFPSQVTIKKLENVGSRIFRIDQKGAVRVEIGENVFSAKYCLD